MKSAFFVTAVLACLMPLTVHSAVVKTETIRITPPPQETPQIDPEDTLKYPEEPAATSGDAPTVYYDVNLLPEPVRATRNALVSALREGSIEKIGAIIEAQKFPPHLLFGEMEDPVTYLKQSSGDGEGLEIMAIMADILDAGFVRWNAGTENETYIWPYFAHYPMNELTNKQKTEMFRIVTAADYFEMKDYGTWTFYRLGIAADGQLMYFVAGD
ncbi:hypothetical protein [Pseudovibrio sp. SPO723]|uniref:hypothetical protein n=1 Tax=Nesiotobacter zosterae TaxID=392721 RepID=UPI0029C12CED|nr:hypothetical protein [Pseudovibrio sp. SPO723]MDX5593099.1 hypothetical protein [Pseudovibrio sp. SPO723]